MGPIYWTEKSSSRTLNSTRAKLDWIKSELPQLLSSSALQSFSLSFIAVLGANLGIIRKMFTRIIEFNEYYSKNKRRFSKNRLRLASLRTERPVRRRPRSLEEERILIKLTALRWKKWQERGIIKKTGERKFQVKIF